MNFLKYQINQIVNRKMRNRVTPTILLEFLGRHKTFK